MQTTHGPIWYRNQIIILNKLAIDTDALLSAFIIMPFRKMSSIVEKKITSKDSRKMLLIRLSRLRQISLRRRNAVTTILLRLRSKDTTLQLDPFRSASLLSASIPNPARISSCERTHVFARNWKVTSAAARVPIQVATEKRYRITQNKPSIRLGFVPRRYECEVFDIRWSGK